MNDRTERATSDAERRIARSKVMMDPATIETVNDAHDLEAQARRTLRGLDWSYVDWNYLYHASPILERTPRGRTAVTGD